MADNLIYQLSAESQQTAEPFVNKTIPYVIDMNNQSYGSGQVQIDTSSLSNSGRWCSYADAILQIPIVTALFPTTAITGWDNCDASFAVGIKNGFWHYIHSMSVELNGVTCVQLTPYSNIHVGWKAMTSFSQDDLQKLGPSLGFYPDTPDSFTFNTLASAEGMGSSNNRNKGFENLYPSAKGAILTTAQVGIGNTAIATATSLIGEAFSGLYNPNYPFKVESGNTSAPATSAVGYPQLTTANFGFYKRQKITAFDPKAYSDLISVADMDKIWRNYYYTTTTGTTNKNAKVWQYLATIRLKDMSDLFQQLPLTRGLYMRLILNCNLSTTTLKASVQAATATTPALTKWEVDGTPTLTNGTAPVMFASSGVGQGSYYLPTMSGGEKLILQTAIASLTPGASGGDTAIGTISHFSKSCRLYVPSFQMTPQAELAFLEMAPTKTIVYRDIFQYQIMNCTAGQTQNALVTNGIVNPKQITLFTFFSPSANPTTANALSPIISPFATEPATCSPLTGGPFLSNFQVLLAGQNIFQLNQTYSWQNYWDEVQHYNAINGSETTGLNSGLISYTDYMFNMGVLTVDISRRVSSENLVPKSIQLQFYNYSARSVDVYVFVEVERSFVISTSNSQILG